MKTSIAFTALVNALALSVAAGGKDSKAPSAPQPYTTTWSMYTFTQTICTPTATVPYTVTNTWYETSVVSTPHTSTATWGSELYDCATSVATTSYVVS